MLHDKGMARKQGRPAQAKSRIVAKLPLACADEDAAVAFLEEMRWGKDAPACPTCGSIGSTYPMLNRKTKERGPRYLWRCKAKGTDGKKCNRQFTVRVGTVFEDSKIPLRHWCYAFWAACASKKGVSALQIKRQTGLSYESALFMMHRIRWAMADDRDTPPKLKGVVEADETWVGGKPRHRHKRNRGRYAERKVPVMVLVERKGDARAMPIERVDSGTLQSAIVENVDPASSTLMTDENKGYPAVGRRFAGGHFTVTHSKGEYVRGLAHSNTAESFFSLFKRGLIGTFHSVSKRHLHRYVSEFEFRWNTRDMEDGERTMAAIQKAQGKRLMYRAPKKRPA